MAGAATMVLAMKIYFKVRICRGREDDDDEGNVEFPFVKDGKRYHMDLYKSSHIF